MSSPFSPSSLSIYWPILVQGAMVSVVLGLIGCFLVVRGMSLLGDALSHSVLPGIVLGFLVGSFFGNSSLGSPWILVGATATGLAAALLVEWVQQSSRVKEDASLGITFTTLFAAGVVMVNLFAGQTDLDPGCVLYGNLEGFLDYGHGAPGEVKTMAWIAVGVVALLIVFYRQLLVSTFDRSLAVSLGIPARWVHYALMAVLSLTIVASFESVGVVLPVALLILPGCTAPLWADRMPSMLLIAAVHALLSTAIGYWLSHPSVLNTTTGAAICVAGFAMLLVSWLLAPRHGLLPRRLARARLVRTTHQENLLKTLSELGGAADDAKLSGELRMPRRAYGRALSRAVASGYVSRTPGGYALSRSGAARSAKLVRAHELWEQYLRQEVGLNADHVHDAAEWVEHYLSDEKVDRIDEVVKGAAKSGA